MPTYETSTNLNPMDAGEIKVGEMVIEPDLLEMVKKVHTLFYAKTNVLAYSYQHAAANGESDSEAALQVPDGESIYVYKFTVRRFCPEQDLELHVWCQGVDIDVEYQDDADAWASIATTASSGAALERLVIPLTNGVWSDNDGGGNDPDDLWRLRLRVTATATIEATAGQVYGMVLIEKPLDPATTTSTDEDAGEIFVLGIKGMDGFVHQDSSSLSSNASFNVMSLRMLLRNIETMAERKRRGCAVVFPYPLRYALSSVYWRGDGPFQWKASPWCGKVTVLADCEQLSEPNSSGDLRLLIGAFSDAVREDVRTSNSLRNHIYANPQPSGSDGNVVIRQDDTLNNCVKRMVNIKVRAGEQNNVFLAYRGQYGQGIDPFVEDMDGFFESWNEGTFRMKYRNFGGTFDAATAFINGFGYHALMRVNVPSSYSRPPVPVPADYWPLPGDEEDVDSYHIFDIACFRGLDIAEGDNMYLTASPSPPFANKDFGQTGPDTTYQVQAGRHGWGRLNSLWINEEYSGADLYRFAVANRPPGASLVYSYLTLLNNMLDHAWTVNGIRHVNDGRHRTIDIPEAPAKFGNGVNYFITRSLQEYYDKISNPKWVVAGQFPVTVQLDPGSASGVPKRTYTKVKFRVHYRVFCLNNQDDGTSEGRDPAESQDEDSEDVRLVLKARATMGSSPCEGVSDVVITSDVGDIDIKDKISSKSDIKTFTEWDAWASSSIGSLHLGNDYHKFNTLNQVAWPSEIIGEKYPWDIFEVEATLPTTGDFPSADDERLGHRPEFGFPAWVRLELSFYTYMREGTGSSPGTMSGGSMYNLVIAGISCVPSEYPLEVIE